jgi:hypothetical protein
MTVFDCSYRFFQSRKFDLEGPLLAAGSAVTGLHCIGLKNAGVARFRVVVVLDACNDWFACGLAFISFYPIRKAVPKSTIAKSTVMTHSALREGTQRKPMASPPAWH